MNGYEFKGDFTELNWFIIKLNWNTINKKHLM